MLNCLNILFAAFRTQTLKKDLADTAEAVQKYKEHMDATDVAEVADGGAQLMRRLEGFQELAAGINEEEGMFGCVPYLSTIICGAVSSGSAGRGLAPGLHPPAPP